MADGTLRVILRSVREHPAYNMAQVAEDTGVPRYLVERYFREHRDAFARAVREGRKAAKAPAE